MLDIKEIKNIIPVLFRFGAEKSNSIPINLVTNEILAFALDGRIDDVELLDQDLHFNIKIPGLAVQIKDKNNFLPLISKYSWLTTVELLWGFDENPDNYSFTDTNKFRKLLFRQLLSVFKEENYTDFLHFV